MHRKSHLHKLYHLPSTLERKLNVQLPPMATALWVTFSFLSHITTFIFHMHIHGYPRTMTYTHSNQTFTGTRWTLTGAHAAAQIAPSQ